jgi:homoserine O-acetyltransferase
MNQDSASRSLIPAFLCWFALAFTALASTAQAQGDLRFADLGEFPLESGQTIKVCKIGYRTYGELNRDKSNAILFPSWFGGTSKDLAQFVNPSGPVDSSKYFVVTVDAIGNGISSSPSNSATEGGKAFPKFSIRDMVESQRRLLTEVLGISHLHAVMGISMGGIQTFQWIVGHPDFMDNAISIVGSPRMDPYNLLLFQTELNAIEELLAAHSDPHKGRAAAMRVVADVHQLALSTPPKYNAENSREEFAGKLATIEAELIQRMDPYDWASQLRAIIGHDVSARLGGNMQRAAEAVNAQLLVIVGLRDHMVTPDSALDFAKRTGARTLALDSDCGHLAFACEIEQVRGAVRGFLEE